MVSKHVLDETWRGEQADRVGRDLSKFDFEGLGLECFNFIGANLEGAHFEDTILYSTQFVGANLEGAFFGGADAVGANFAKANLRNANFMWRNRWANLNYANFQGASLGAVNLSGNTIEQMTGNRPSGYTYRPIGLEGTKFGMSELGGAYFDTATLRYVDFEGADLHGAQFRETTLIGVSFKGANLQGADFTGATLENVDFGEADLEDAKLYGAVLSDVSFEGANLIRCAYNDKTKWGGFDPSGTRAWKL